MKVTSQAALVKHFLGGHSLGWQRLAASPLSIPPPDIEAALSWRLALNVGPCPSPDQGGWLLTYHGHHHALTLLVRSAAVSSDTQPD